VLPTLPTFTLSALSAFRPPAATEHLIAAAIAHCREIAASR